MNFKAALDALDVAAKEQAIDAAIKVVKQMTPDYGGVPEVVIKERVIEHLHALAKTFQAPDTGHSEGQSKTTERRSPDRPAAPPLKTAMGPT